MAILSAALVSSGCSGAPIIRSGPEQQRVVARTYAVSSIAARTKILDAFEQPRSALAEPFRQMTANALMPPFFSPDWLVTLVDPGSFLDPYKRMPPADKVNDLLLQEDTGDFYWPSEYMTRGADRPVPFHCGLIVHFVPRPPSSTEIQIYEMTPTVWVGEHWAFSAHGVGFGRYHDIRFVEPTVTDRVKALDVLDRVLIN